MAKQTTIFCPIFFDSFDEKPLLLFTRRGYVDSDQNLRSYAGEWLLAGELKEGRLGASYDQAEDLFRERTGYSENILGHTSPIEVLLETKEGNLEALIHFGIINQDELGEDQRGNTLSKRWFQPEVALSYFSSEGLDNEINTRITKLGFDSVRDPSLSTLGAVNHISDYLSK